MSILIVSNEWSKYSRQFFNKDTPIIATTANASKKDQKACSDAGMVDFISKPFEMADLERVFTTWCDVDLKPLPNGQYAIEREVDGEISILDVERIKIMSEQFGEKFSVILDQYY